MTSPQEDMIAELKIVIDRKNDQIEKLHEKLALSERNHDGARAVTAELQSQIAEMAEIRNAQLEQPRDPHYETTRRFLTNACGVMQDKLDRIRAILSE